MAPTNWPEKVVDYEAQKPGANYEAQKPDADYEAQNQTQIMKHKTRRRL